jgi:hypothetical protein
MSEQETKSHLPPVYVHKAMMNFADGRRFVVCFIPRARVPKEDLRSLRYFPGTDHDATHLEISDRLREKCLHSMGKFLSGSVGKLIKIRVTSFDEARAWVHTNAGAMLILTDSVEWAPLGKLFDSKVMPHKGKSEKNSEVVIVLFPEHY